jgi:hypothetical protein
MQQSPSSEAKKFSTSQDILHFMKPDVSLPSQDILHFMKPEVSLHLQIQIILGLARHPIFWRSILILSYQLSLGLTSFLFPWGFPTKTLDTNLLFPYELYFPPNSSNTKVLIKFRSHSEFQKFPASFRAPRYNNFLTTIRRIPVKHSTGFIFIQIEPLHVRYMFQVFLRPSSDMSI